MDFLGLRNLSIIERCLELVEEGTGERVDIDGVHLDDAKTFELLQSGNTIGVFQLEGNAMRSLIRSLKPDSFDDVIALVALYRPGPMGANMHNLYADRKNGRAPIEELHPALTDKLADTYQIMVYQEQVMSVAQEMAGYSMVDADNLRRAMGKKIKVGDEGRGGEVRRRLCRPGPRREGGSGDLRTHRALLRIRVQQVPLAAMASSPIRPHS